MEGTSGLLRIAQIDWNADGTLSDEEFLKVEQTSEKMVESATTSLNTNALVAALILTMYVPLEDLVISQESTDFFGSTGSDVIVALAVTSNVTVIALCVMVIFMSVNMNIWLSYNLPTGRAKMMFLHKTAGSSYTIVLSTNTLYVVFLLSIWCNYLCESPTRGWSAAAPLFVLLLLFQWWRTTIQVATEVLLQEAQLLLPDLFDGNKLGRGKVGPVGDTRILYD